MSKTPSRHAHLVGSVALSDTEAVFTTVCDILGDCCGQIPDGETGARGYWIRWQEKSFSQNASIEPREDAARLKGFKDQVKRTFYGLKDGIDPAALDFGTLGYAEEALASFAIFDRLEIEDKIPSGLRFQVSLPTPVALLSGFVVMEDRARIEPALERAMLGDLEQIQEMVPNHRLAVQWDVCYEIVGADRGPPLHFQDVTACSVERVCRLNAHVRDEVRLGIHLCYGDPGHKHIVEPRDLSLAVAFANGICDGSPRPVDYVHMPVPRSRTDEAYFKPLEQLKLQRATKLVLGLVHYTDGTAGARARMAAADRFVSEYDVATECGFGRRDPQTIPDLLELHRELCMAESP